MKKLATTFGLLALMLVVTSFTTPSEIGGRGGKGRRRGIEVRGRGGRRGGGRIRGNEGGGDVGERRDRRGMRRGRGKKRGTEDRRITVQHLLD